MISTQACAILTPIGIAMLLLVGLVLGIAATLGVCELVRTACGIRSARRRAWHRTTP